MAYEKQSAAGKRVALGAQLRGAVVHYAIAFILLAMAKERAEHRQKTAAMIDPLTGISNRRAFLEEGEENLKRQVNDPRPTAVMLLDLDNFKSINDRYGHAIGDRVLEIFAEVASSCLRRIDLFGRLGGEEFAALLHDTTRERALAVAEQIRTSFAAATRVVEGRPLDGTVSIGVVIVYDACSIFRRCWHRPITRSIAPRMRGATGSRSPRSSSSSIAPGAARPRSSALRPSGRGQSPQPDTKTPVHLPGRIC